MATHSGRNASVKLDTTTIRGIGKWTLDINQKSVDTTEFGDAWEENDVAMSGWKADFSGHVNLNDASQDTLWAAFKANTLIQNLRLYITATKYWAPDLTADSEAGARITSFKMGQSKDGVASLDLSLVGSGPIDLEGV